LGNQEPRNRNSIWDKPRVANVGIKHFASPIQQHGGKVLQFQWNPPAAGDSTLASLLERLYGV
jgi:FdrA protein